MKHIKLTPNLRILYCLASILFIGSSVMGQTVREEKMKKLSFLVGEWVGTSATYKNGVLIKEVPVFEKISYTLDKNLITIDLKSETLQLHTVIYYDEKEETYYYNPYYKNGTNKYPAEYKDGKLIVWPNKRKRFVFSLTPQGDFQEYGEMLEKGKWIKYFEDTFKKTP